MHQGGSGRLLALIVVALATIGGALGLAITHGENESERIRASGSAASTASPTTARTAAEGAVITMCDVKGVKVAHLSYAYGFNGYEVPAGTRWAVDTLANPKTPTGLRSELSGSYDRTAAIVMGAPAPGVTMAPKP